jgi:thiol-disulfide isomerase/thioredoxin
MRFTTFNGAWILSTYPEGSSRPMAISKETFDSGMTGQEFLDVIEANKEKFLENVENATIPDDVNSFFSEHPVSIAAIGEDWCTDVVHFMPVVIKLAQEVEGVELRVFLRDKTDLIDSYLNQGQFKSIPVFVLFDADWNELGHFTERPAKSTASMAEESTRFQRANTDLEGVARSYDNMPDETRQQVRANAARFRWDNFDTWNGYFFDEIKAIVADKAAIA